MSRKSLPYEQIGHTEGKSDLPAHVSGTTRGESWVRDGKREPGRRDGTGRTARDATSIAPSKRNPIDPKMPSLPPP